VTGLWDREKAPFGSPQSAFSPSDVGRALTGTSDVVFLSRPFK